MKSVTGSLRAFRLALLLAISSTLLSFSGTRGGEGFEVYINNKLVLQQFGRNMDDIKTVSLDPSSLNDQLSIKYHHCGHVGKNRRIIIKDEQNKVLKEFQFDDVNDAAASMTCKVKDIVGLQKAKTAIQLKLFYTSSELPKGRQLAALLVQARPTAKL